MDQPDPAQAVSLEDLAWCLRHLRALADTPTYRELERRTVHAEGVLPGTGLRRIPLKRATIADVLAGHAFPRKAFLLTFAEACGVDLREDHRWEQAWNRLAVRYQAQPARGNQQSHEHLAPAAQRADLGEPDRAPADPLGPQYSSAEKPALCPAGAGNTGIGDARTQPQVVADFMDAADGASSSASSLLGRLAWREVARVTAFLQQLPTGQEITYDGEDREWLLGLTRETRRSIDAISLAAVDGTRYGPDSGLWVSDLGVRYLELQQEAIERGVSIRRIFVFEHEGLERDGSFLRITQMQRDTGINIRMLYSRLIPEWLAGMTFDFVIFDDEVSYETMAGTSLHYDDYRPVVVRTVLVPGSSRVQALKKRFEHFWAAADPEAQIFMHRSF